MSSWRVGCDFSILGRDCGHPNNHERHHRVSRTVARLLILPPGGPAVGQIQSKMVVRWLYPGVNKWQQSGSRLPDFQGVCCCVVLTHAHCEEDC